MRGDPVLRHVFDEDALSLAKVSLRSFSKLGRQEDAQDRRYASLDCGC